MGYGSFQYLHVGYVCYEPPCFFGIFQFEKIESCSLEGAIGKDS